MAPTSNTTVTWYWPNASEVGAMPDRLPPPTRQVACFLGDQLTGEVGRLDEPPTIGESENDPQVFGDSHWIEIAVIGALLIAAFSAGAVAFVKIYGVFA